MGLYRNRPKRTDLAGQMTGQIGQTTGLIGRNFSGRSAPYRAHWVARQVPAAEESRLVYGPSTA